jgi:rhodanese-related sulfurtransferase
VTAIVKGKPIWRVGIGFRFLKGEYCMKKTLVTVIGAIFLLLAAGFLRTDALETSPVSGKIERGYRILPIEKTSAEVRLTVYRGDYIKFSFDPSVIEPLLRIPALRVEERLSDDLETAPYFKMKTAGTFAFSLGEVTGEITVIEYRQANYSEVTAEQAAELINNIHPLVLDVRTPAEYQMGHLENSVLIPVQELQSRLQEIEAHKNDDILIYCATGNRSTVAAKILIDAGFKRITNLRHGIAEWQGKNFPVVR